MYMHKLNRYKVKELEKYNGTYYKKFASFLKRYNPCSNVQRRWIDDNVPPTKKGVEFVEWYIKVENDAINKEGISYRRYLIEPLIGVVLNRNIPTLKVGDRVKRGPSWEWWDQDRDKNGVKQLGTVVEVPKTEHNGYNWDGGTHWYTVEWDESQRYRNRYRYDYNYKDIIPTE